MFKRGPQGIQILSDDLKPRAFNQIWFLNKSLVLEPEFADDCLFSPGFVFVRSPKLTVMIQAKKATVHLSDDGPNERTELFLDALKEELPTHKISSFFSAFVCGKKHDISSISQGIVASTSLLPASFEVDNPVTGFSQKSNSAHGPLVFKMEVNEVNDKFGLHDHLDISLEVENTGDCWETLGTEFKKIRQSINEKVS